MNGPRARPVPPSQYGRRRRGYFPVGPLNLASGDLFGLLKDLHIDLPGDHITVYPRIIPLSRVATGFSDEQLSEVYELLKDRVVKKAGKAVSFEPELVFEVGYSELQVSPTYEGGFALRFPRFVRIRDDKDIADVETLDSIRTRYERQTKSAQAYEK